MARKTSLLIGFVLLVAACGGGGGSEGGVASIDEAVAATTTAVTSPDPDGPSGDEDAVLEFSACMRDGGIDFPDPVVDADGNVGFDLLALRDLAEVDQDRIETAFEGCASLLQGVNFGFEDVFESEFQDQLVVFSACMRENGFEMPDPDFTGLIDGEPLFPPFDLEDPDFETAFESCEDTLPGIPGIAGN